MGSKKKVKLSKLEKCDHCGGCKGKPKQLWWLHNGLICGNCMLDIIKKFTLALAIISLISCDDSDQQTQLDGGGSGSSDQGTIADAAGFCSPDQNLGQSSFTSSATDAKIDMDGDPNAKGHDANWQATTSGKVNGQDVNSAHYAYIVMSPGQMAADGVSLGDWAKVTNNATGATTWARVEDEGPAGGTGEISEAAATAVGIQFASNSFTIGDPSVTVNAYGGTSGIQGDCSTQVAQQ
jgi:hypothetical protein